VTATFWLDVGSGRFKIGNEWKSGSRFYQRRHNGFFFPDGLLIEFQRVEVDQPGPKGWDPTNVVRYSAVGDVLWEIQSEKAGNGYREIRACPGGYLEAISRDGLRKYWLKAASGQVFPQDQYPDPKLVLNDEDRCTWSVTGNQVFHRGELRFEKPNRRIDLAYPVDNDLLVLWTYSLSRFPEEGSDYDPQNGVRIRSDGTIVWQIEKEPIPASYVLIKGASNPPGRGFIDLRQGESGLIEVTSSDNCYIYSVDPDSGTLTFLREKEDYRWG
jgi:hypothetical protein